MRHEGISQAIGALNAAQAELTADLQEVKPPASRNQIIMLRGKLAEVQLELIDYRDKNP